MIAWANFAVLIVSGVLLTVFYVRSVGPAVLEQKIGPSAYAKCARYRRISAVFMFVAAGNYVIYYFYPLPVPLPRTFPWPWWVSAVGALVIAIPAGYLMWRGVKDAGAETMTPKKEHTLYGGIYERIRHPQAAGEVFYWWVIAFLLHSPFLALLSFAWLPVWWLLCWAEERDLVLRYGAAYEAYRQRTGAFIP